MSMDYRVLLQTFSSTVEKAVEELAKQDGRASQAAVQRQTGQRTATKDVAEAVKKLLEGTAPLTEASLRALCVQWRGQSLKEFSDAFQAELTERYKSRYYFGMAYGHGLASLELEQYLRTLKKKEAENQGGTAA